MIRNPLIEMTLLTGVKETKNKLQWDANVDGTTFTLYIPKWRVPEPWPKRIWVEIVARRSSSDDLPNLSVADVKADSSIRHEPIVTTVEKYAIRSQTIRYQPLGDKKKWEIGEPYVPFSLTENGSIRLRLIILWDISSRGRFPVRQQSVK